MMVSYHPYSLKTILGFSAFLTLIIGSSAQLSTDFYSHSCPRLFGIVFSVLNSSIQKEARIGASLLRLFFHDCFVNGCDGSVLLDDRSNSPGEKSALPNLNSARGFDVIDDIKSAVEKVCPGVVSCADVLAIVARDSVLILGGPFWDVKLGRRDARSASQATANRNLPSPNSNLSLLISKFNDVGLSVRDMVALSGAHTIGQAHCRTFRARIYNETNIDSSFAQTVKRSCPIGSGNDNLAPLDVHTPTSFDNSFFKNLVRKRGLLHSDQQLFNGGATDSIVRSYNESRSNFSDDFVAAMVRMGGYSAAVRIERRG